MEYAKVVGAATAVGVGGGILVAPYVAPAVLSSVGFTSSGVAAGSFAAATQSGIGSVAAGSTFAVLQSAGAAGIGTAGTLATGAVSGAASAGAAIFRSVSTILGEETIGCILLFIQVFKKFW